VKENMMLQDASCKVFRKLPVLSLRHLANSVKIRHKP
jgi:hypothetical protein